MSADTFLYFAYGSNMLLARLRERCSSAFEPVVAELRGYELRWHKKSIDGSGKCDIVKSDQLGASVFGVLFTIAIKQKDKLDKAEGLGAGYDERQVEVLRGADRRIATAYVATITDPRLNPYTWYRALVVAGAKERRLPADYIAHLEAVAADVDPNQARHDKNMALIDEARA